jgi:hypothetical protein
MSRWFARQPRQLLKIDLVERATKVAMVGMNPETKKRRRRRKRRESGVKDRVQKPVGTAMMFRNLGRQRLAKNGWMR